MSLQKNGDARRQARGRRSPTVAYEVSERRACSALGTDRAFVRYRSRRPDDRAVRSRLRELASVRRGSAPAASHPATREGIAMNHQELRRLYGEERLQVRRRGGGLRCPSWQEHIECGVRPRRDAHIDDFGFHDPRLDADDGKLITCMTLRRELIQRFRHRPLALMVAFADDLQSRSHGAGVVHGY